MISLERHMEHRWIIDKNVNSKELLSEFAVIMKDVANALDFDDIKQYISQNGIYQGRNNDGYKITIGVRLLQACYYMFGYSFNSKNAKKVFMPSPMTVNIFSTNNPKIHTENYLVNLFSMQYPNPFNRTPSCFEIYIGRLIVKLLLDKRIEQKLYIDECVWFLPFIEKVSSNVYEELIESIIEYRNLTYDEKLHMFQSVRNYNYLFSNVMHEMNYYFLRLFNDFGVLSISPDPNHNDGKIFRFKHGNGKTYRNDAWKSRAACSGYVKLSEEIIDSAIKLSERFSAFDIPTKENDDFVLSRRDWLTNLYEIEPLEYLDCIGSQINRQNEVSAIVNQMIYASKYGSRDGKEFETALEPFMELFRETRNIEIISGAGNTDLLCTMENFENDSLYKMNVDAKTRGKALEGINPSRITRHIDKHGAKFCVVVAPKFARGVSYDIKNSQIVTVRSEDFGAYCYRECIKSNDGQADFSSIYNIISTNLGTDITEHIRELTAMRYGVICE